MLKHRSIVLAAATAVSLAALAASGVAQLASFGGERIKFPESYAKGVLYTTVDRPDNKQYRELFATPEAIEAARKGQPLPNGTVLTLVQYKAKLDAQGNPEKDAQGRFIKDELIGYTVMEKQAGWGTQIPEDIRNSTWEYQAFTAAKAVNTKANLKGCYECHKKLEPRLDFVFSYDKMAAHK